MKKLFLKIRNIHRKTIAMTEVSLKSCRPSVKFCEILRTPILTNICQRLVLTIVDGYDILRTLS